ncbi:hypothetical protein M3231_00280 [Neobacillus mesonae]|nr:hypothetical protein [Neobacillus mesonae]
MHHDNKKFSIDFPDDERMGMEIERIVSKGLMPKRTLYISFRQMSSQLGWKVLFKDRAEIGLITLLGLLLMVLMGYAAGEQSNSESALSMSVVIFTMSPVLYFAIAVMFFVQLRSRDTYETEMVCKYSVHQLAAFRMLVFSLLSLAANIISILLLAVRIEGIDVIKSILMSASSLFVFSALFMYFQLHMSSLWSWLIAGMSWISVNALLYWMAGSAYEQLLNQIPVLVYGGLTIVGFILYVRHLKQLFYLQQAGG